MNCRRVILWAGLSCDSPARIFGFRKSRENHGSNPRISHSWRSGAQTYAFHIPAWRDKAVGGAHPSGSRRSRICTISSAAPCVPRLRGAGSLWWQINFPVRTATCPNLVLPRKFGSRPMAAPCSLWQKTVLNHGGHGDHGDRTGKTN